MMASAWGIADPGGSRHGLFLAWIAVKGMGKEEVLATLSLSGAWRPLTPDEDEFSFRISCAEIPCGWMHVLTQNFDYATAERMTALSTGGVAVACAVEEHVMVSQAWGYADGRQVWSILHDGGNRGTMDLETTGDLPSAFMPIREKLVRQQGAEDAGDAMVDYMFDLPVELADALVGYRHDRAPPKGQELAFSTLATSDRRERGTDGRGGGLFKAIAGLFKRG